MITAKVIITMGAAFGALTTMAFGAWKALDYTELRPALIKELRMSQSSIEDLSQSVLLIKFQLLREKQKLGNLTFEEQQELCRISRVLGYVGVQGCP
jgi:hypothetical protein